MTEMASLTRNNVQKRGRIGNRTKSRVQKLNLRVTDNDLVISAELIYFSSKFSFNH